MHACPMDELFFYSFIYFCILKIFLKKFKISLLFLFKINIFLYIFRYFGALI
jgi:hypothetical protein